MTKFGPFTWGEKPVLDAPHPDPDKVLHEPRWIVQTMGGGLNSADSKYVAENFDTMLTDPDLIEYWGHVHIGQPEGIYRAALRACRAEYLRTHPNFDAKAYYLENKRLVCVPTPSGVEIYEVLRIKDKGKPDETVDLENQKPWLVAPVASTQKDVLQLIGNQRREDKILDENRKIREILGGRK